MTEAELNALKFLTERGGSVLVTEIPDRNEKGLWGETIPGIRVYRKLEKQGLIILTEEEPIDIDGEPFEFTPMVEITDAGKRIRTT